MQIFRITHRIYAGQLSASGNAGRWNYRNERVIYCAASRALASLELLVHSSGEKLRNGDFKISIISCPDNISMNIIHKKQLPLGWNGLSPYNPTQVIGSRWIASNNAAILKVPSSIIVNESNYIINVNHPQFSKFRILDVEDFICDSRIVEKMKE